MATIDKIPEDPSSTERRDAFLEIQREGRPRKDRKRTALTTDAPMTRLDPARNAIASVFVFVFIVLHPNQP